VSPSTPPPEIDALIDEIRRRVAERRRSGFYPEGLEDDLDAHFRRIVSHRRGAATEAVRESLLDLDAQSHFSPDRIPTATRLPGGDTVHRVVRKLTSRQTQGALQQVQEFSDALRSTLRLILDALEEPGDHLHADLAAQLDAVWERFAAWERGPVDSAAALGDLRRRVEALEAAEQARRFTPPYTAAEFEAAFRGGADELKARYRDLAELVAGSAPVLDIGCGRGEFLELLGTLGAAGRGVELDPVLAASGREAGLDITTGDGIAHLAAQPDGSLGAVVLLQVVEHLTPQQLVDLITIAKDKVRRGGMLLMETVNPQSLYTFARAFYLDPTHTNPIHPAYLRFLVQQAGFADVRLEWRSPPDEDEVPVPDPAAGPVAAANIVKINRLLFAPQDYAVVAIS